MAKLFPARYHLVNTFFLSYTFFSLILMFNKDVSKWLFLPEFCLRVQNSSAIHCAAVWSHPAVRLLWPPGAGGAICSRPVRAGAEARYQCSASDALCWSSWHAACTRHGVNVGDTCDTSVTRVVCHASVFSDSVGLVALSGAVPYVRLADAVPATLCHLNA